MLKIKLRKSTVKIELNWPGQPLSESKVIGPLFKHIKKDSIDVNRKDNFIVLTIAKKVKEKWFNLLKIDPDSAKKQEILEQSKMAFKRSLKESDPGQGTREGAGELSGAGKGRNDYYFVGGVGRAGVDIQGFGERPEGGRGVDEARFGLGGADGGKVVTPPKSNFLSDLELADQTWGTGEVRGHPDGQNMSKSSFKLGNMGSKKGMFMTMSRSHKKHEKGAREAERDQMGVESHQRGANTSGKAKYSKNDKMIKMENMGTEELMADLGLVSGGGRDHVILPDHISALMKQEQDQVLSNLKNGYYDVRKVSRKLRMSVEQELLELRNRERLRMFELEAQNAKNSRIQEEHFSTQIDKKRSFQKKQGSAKKVTGTKEAKKAKSKPRMASKSKKTKKSKRRQKITSRENKKQSRQKKDKNGDRGGSSAPQKQRSKRGLVFKQDSSRRQIGAKMTSTGISTVNKKRKTGEEASAASNRRQRSSRKAIRAEKSANLANLDNFANKQIFATEGVVSTPKLPINNKGLSKIMEQSAQLLNASSFDQNSKKLNKTSKADSRTYAGFQPAQQLYRDKSEPLILSGVKGVSQKLRIDDLKEEIVSKKKYRSKSRKHLNPGMSSPVRSKDDQLYPFEMPSDPKISKILKKSVLTNSVKKGRSEENLNTDSMLRRAGNLSGIKSVSQIHSKPQKSEKSVKNDLKAKTKNSYKKKTLKISTLIKDINNNLMSIHNNDNHLFGSKNISKSTRNRSEWYSGYQPLPGTTRPQNVSTRPLRTALDYPRTTKFDNSPIAIAEELKNLILAKSKTMTERPKRASAAVINSVAETQEKSSQRPKKHQESTITQKVSKSQNKAKTGSKQRTSGNGGNNVSRGGNGANKKKKSKAIRFSKTAGGNANKSKRGRSQKIEKMTKRIMLKSLTPKGALHGGRMRDVGVKSTRNRKSIKNSGNGRNGGNGASKPTRGGRNKEYEVDYDPLESQNTTQNVRNNIDRILSKSTRIVTQRHLAGLHTEPNAGHHPLYSQKPFNNFQQPKTTKSTKDIKSLKTNIFFDKNSIKGIQNHLQDFLILKKSRSSTPPPIISSSSSQRTIPKNYNRPLNKVFKIVGEDTEFLKELKKYEFLQKGDKVRLQTIVIDILKNKLLDEQRLRLEREKELEEVLRVDNIRVLDLEERLMVMKFKRNHGQGLSSLEEQRRNLRGDVPGRRGGVKECSGGREFGEYGMGGQGY